MVHMGPREESIVTIAGVVDWLFGVLVLVAFDWHLAFFHHTDARKNIGSCPSGGRDVLEDPSAPALRDVIDSKEGTVQACALLLDRSRSGILLGQCGERTD